MADYSAIREQIRVRLATISGLYTYAVFPDKILCPAAIVVASEGLEQLTMGGGLHQVTFEVLLLVAPLQPGGERAQSNLDAYLDDTGASSVKAALNGGKTLAGEAETLNVLPFRDYGSLEVNGIEYVGARFPIEIWT